jgi:hypothetical protein
MHYSHYKFLVLGHTKRLKNIYFWTLTNKGKGVIKKEDLSQWVSLAFKKALTPHNIRKGFEMTTTWPLILNAMARKIHLSKSFIKMQEPINVMDVVEDLQI